MLILLLQAGIERYGVEAARVVEVIPPASVRRVPHAPDYVAGLLNYRGTAVPVVDLNRLLTARSAELLLSTRIILFQMEAPDGGYRLLGLLAERVTETVRCRAEDFSPAGVAPAEAPYLGRVRLGENLSIQLLRPEKIVPEELLDALLREQV